MRTRGPLAVLSLVICLAACGSGASVNGTAAGTGAGGDHVITGVGGSGGNGLDTTSGVTTSVAATTSSTGTGGPVCPPTPPAEGPPITAPADTWTWVPIPGSRCRGGSQTGIGVRMKPSSKRVFIYLEGGGACFNGTTCAISLNSFGQIEFGAWAGTVGQTGIFDDNNPENPVRDWNAVYVPYCSGDVHAGSATGVNVPGGPSNQTFTGYDNMGLYLQQLVPTFKDAPQVLLTGISAGGFGAALNYDRVAAAFCPQPVTLLDDSGPPMADQYLAPCLQKQWRDLWNLASTLPVQCTACDGSDGGGIVNYVNYLSATWPDANMGLISSTQDEVISTFYGFGTANCTQSTPIPGPTYAMGLEDLRHDYLANSDRWGTYFIDSTQHTWLLGPGYFTTSVKGKKLTSWIAELLDGHPGNVGP